MLRIVLILLASIALVFAQDSITNDTSSTTSGTTTSHSSNSTTESPKVTTTTLPSTTTHKTEKPTTSTPPPTTTTKPTTSTVAPTPPPVPQPEQFSGNVTEGNNTCINVEFSVKITIKYNNTKNEVITTGFTIPKNASVVSPSHCRRENTTEEETITIAFDNEEHTSANLTINFNKTSDNTVLVNEVMLSFVATSALMPQLEDKLIGQIISADKSQLTLFKVATDHSYVCSAVQSATLDSHVDRIVDLQIEFTNSKVEAYIDQSKKGQFDSEIDCKSSDISDVVPIAVGAALAGLVIIVLIAYFIGRRRSRRLAYQSV